MKKKILIALITLMCATTLTACQVKSPKICYTVYPIQFLVERLAGDKVKTCRITSDGNILRSQIIDDYQEQLSDADLFLYMGQVEPFMHIYLSQIKQNKDMDIINLAGTTSIYSFKRYTQVQVGESKVFIESPYYESSLFNSVDTYDSDPYIWLDPIAMTSLASQIRDWLVTHYTEESDYFEKQYDLLEAELARLDSEFQMLRLSSSNIKVVTMTPSFGVWQKNYNIEVYPIIMSRYGVLPTNEQLNVIKRRIINDDVKYIALEPNLSDDMIALYNQIKDELGLVEITLSNLATLTPQQITEKRNYIHIMYENLAQLELLTD
ncbi:MAG: metal ABC transporter substrate-binding protein [Erysipelotrichaceae bacterium]|nr:metal ABC transporter substrate-binding protein [Erysipelotrichaceae bacterium]